MRNLRKRFDIFCFKHRNKGIPNLMLYIVLGSGLVFLMSLFNGGNIIYQWICFDKAKILNGQVWRLLTHVLTHAPGSNYFLVLIGLYFFYHFSRQLEHDMGTLKFNLYYFSGVILMDIFAMIFCPTTITASDGVYILPSTYTAFYNNMAYYMHLSLLLCFCVTRPDAQFVVFFLLPVKAWFLSLIYIFLVVLDIYNLWPLFPSVLLPLVGLLNLLIFSGKDILNLLPPAIRPVPRKKATKKENPIQFRPAPKAEPKKENFNHKCCVCGRTDVSNPELEFRYCSRCHGYHCYCQDHISNHTHIEE